MAERVQVEVVFRGETGETFLSHPSAEPVGFLEGFCSRARSSDQKQKFRLGHVRYDGNYDVLQLWI